MTLMVSLLPHLNATLNLLATVLLVYGGYLIRRRQEDAHRRVMLACFGVSCLFLISYLTYHALAGHRSFSATAPSAVRLFYFVILISHILLAALVPVLAIVAIYLGFRDKRLAHRRVVRWAYPIWLYVSITGVVVYIMLYQLYPSGPELSSIWRVDW